MESLGKHILLDLYECKNVDQTWSVLESVFSKGLSDGNFTVISNHHHEFEPHGVSGVFVLAESHLSFHIWTELNFISLDVYWCGASCDEQKLINVICGFFEPSYLEYHYKERGFFDR